MKVKTTFIAMLLFSYTLFADTIITTFGQDYPGTLVEIGETRITWSHKIGQKVTFNKDDILAILDEDGSILFGAIDVVLDYYSSTLRELTEKMFADGIDISTLSAEESRSLMDSSNVPLSIEYFKELINVTVENIKIARQEERQARRAQIADEASRIAEYHNRFNSPARYQFIVVGENIMMIDSQTAVVYYAQPAKAGVGIMNFLAKGTQLIPYGYEWVRLFKRGDPFDQDLINTEDLRFYSDK